MNQRPAKKMTPDLAHMILKEIGLPAEYSWVDDERYEAAQYALDCMDELRRFREREGFVQQALLFRETWKEQDEDAWAKGWEREFDRVFNAVRGFKVSE